MSLSLSAYVYSFPFPTLGGGYLKAYLLVKINFVNNLGLLILLWFTISLTILRH